jgi:hypothetical protein
MEALGFMLLYFYHGRLPWQGIYGSSVPDKLRRMGDMKAKDAVLRAFAGSPPEFLAYFSHCRDLAFDERPDYQYLRGLFKGLMERSGWQYDFAFDWCEGATPAWGNLLPDKYNIKCS